MPPLRPLPLLSPLPTLSARTPSILSTHSHPSSHPSSISSASLLSSRSFTKSSSRAADTPHESHYDPPSGWLFGVPPGEKYKKEGWEGIWVWGFWGSLGLATVAYAYKPDSSIQTWALEEARRRLEAEGILPDPSSPAVSQSTK